MKLEKGTTINLYVSRENIDISEPCKKDLCMLTMSVGEYLKDTYGSGNYYIKSTTNGCKFTLDGYRYTCAFPPATAKKIFNYDRTFKKTHSKEKTRSSVTPFRSKLMVMESHKIPAPDTPEVRKRKNESQNRIYHEKKAKGLPHQRYSGQREISL